MAKYPYIPKSNTIKEVFGTKIYETGIQKWTYDTLGSLGLTSSNDRPILQIMKFLGFINSDGSITDQYRSYRNKSQSKAIMANAVRSAYSELFTAYPDANNKDVEALRNFFSSKTDLGAQAIGDIVNTFKTLCEFADFGAPLQTNSGTGSTQQVTPVVTAPGQSQGLTVNLNIQLQLPATEDATIYDKIFESMKKHLLKS